MISVYNKDERKVFAPVGKNLLELLQKNGYDIAADCGGNGKCGKCLVDIEIDGVRQTVFACKTPLADNMSVYLKETTAKGLTFGVDNFIKGDKEGLGLALDIGTTTLAFYFVDLLSGKTLSTYSCLNPQRSFGADVVSRISYSIENSFLPLTNALKDKINEIIEKECSLLGKKLDLLVATGNTVMMHLFVGEKIESFGTFPFTPVFLEKREYDNKLGYNADKIIVLPSFSSFVGADIVCGGLSSNIENGNNILIDLGTNGEILCHSLGKIYTTSVAAGPAFEGANIECGMGGIKGAISSVYCDKDEIKYSTIENAPAVGICGSGLIDAIAVMLEKGVIDASGAFTNGKDRFYITENIYISDKDVRNFQLAKSAVRSGIDAILDKLENKNIDNLFVCGGLGYYIHLDNAVKVGLIPESLSTKAKALGNTAVSGAKACLLSNEYLDKASTLSKKAINIDLSFNTFFLNAFIENMTF